MGGSELLRRWGGRLLLNQASRVPALYERYKIQRFGKVAPRLEGWGKGRGALGNQHSGRYAVSELNGTVSDQFQPTIGNVNALLITEINRASRASTARPPERAGRCKQIENSGSRNSFRPRI